MPSLVEPLCGANFWNVRGDYESVHAGNSGNAAPSLRPSEGAVIRLPAMREGAARLVSAEVKRIDAARAGDREAFDTLLSEHEGMIRKFVLKRVPREQVDDLLQDIWLAAWASIADFDRRSRFKTWLYGIAINKCKTHYRSQQRRFLFVSLDDAPEKSAAPPEPDSDVAARISAMIERLSDGHRQLLDLYYYGEMTLPEISRLLNRNLNTVKYQFYRAHAELTNLMREDQSK